MNGRSQTAAELWPQSALGLATVETILNRAIGYPVARQPLGRRYLAAEGDGTGGDAGADAGADGDASATAGQQTAGKQQGTREGAEAGGEEYVRIPKSNIKNISPDGDFNKVVHMAKQYQDLTKDGFGDLVEMARSGGLSGHDLIVALTKEPEDRTATEQAAVDEAAADPKQAAKDIQAAAVEEGKYVSPQEAKKMAQEAAQEAVSQLRESWREETDYGRAKGEETKAIAKALSEVGYDQTPKRVNFRGREEEMDIASYILEPALMRRCQELLEAAVHPRDPDRQRKINAPFTPAIVDQAARELAPFMKEILRQAASSGDGEPEAEAAVAAAASGAPKKKLPPASIHGGQGGRPQKSIEDMTIPERKQLALQRFQARRKATGAKR